MSLELFLDGPIIAVSTPTTGNSALAILRLSGILALNDLQKYFTIKVSSLRPRYAHLTKIIDMLGSVIDEAIIVYYPAPGSFNGENILEMNVHGNVANVESILALFLADGKIRLAAPGEFTYRALKNQKLTLGQVEGLDLLLNAASPQVARTGLQLLNGELYQQYLQLTETYKLALASLELQIDFAEDVGEEQAKNLFSVHWSNLMNTVMYLFKRVGPGVSQLLHPTVVITGKANAGKSSLFNLLLREDRSLVSKIPGTTRDYIAETIRYQSTLYRLVDTAGLRFSAGRLEREGMDRAQQLQENAFFKILVINPFQTQPIFSWSQAQIDSFDLVLFSHGDRSTAERRLKKILSTIPGYHADKVVLCDLRNQIHSSGPIGPGEQVLAKVHEKYQQLMNSTPILVERQAQIITQLNDLVHKFDKIWQMESDIAVLASEFQQIGQKIGELLGIITPDEVLNTIFKNFCIGK